MTLDLDNEEMRQCHLIKDAIKVVWDENKIRPSILLVGLSGMYLGILKTAGYSVKEVKNDFERLLKAYSELPDSYV